MSFIYLPAKICHQFEIYFQNFYFLHLNSTTIQNAKVNISNILYAEHAIKNKFLLTVIL